MMSLSTAQFQQLSQDQLKKLQLQQQTNICNTILSQRQMYQSQQENRQMQQSEQIHGQQFPFQSNQYHMQLKQSQQTNELQEAQQIQLQQIQFQTSTGQRIQFSSQKVSQNMHVHIQHRSQTQNVQFTKPSQISLVSNGQQLHQTQVNPFKQQKLLIVHQRFGPISAKCEIEPSINMVKLDK